ncbi:MAG: O-antigen ligase family protein [Candidatus Omnitrophica bacterium]|nr:O-antigen ligase family protein [Candidatus Omnitrophota bacterium]
MPMAKRRTPEVSHDVQTSTSSATHRWLIAYVCLLPLMVIKDLPLMGSKIQLSEIAFLFLLGAVYREQLQRRFQALLTPLGYALMFFLGVAGLSAAVSLDRRVSLVEFVAYGYMALLYLLVVNTVRTWHHWLQVLNIWVVVSTGVALLGVLGVFLAFIGIPTPFATQWGHLFIIKHPFWAASSTFFASPTPAMLYEYLHLGTLLTLGFLCRPMGRARQMWYGSALVVHLLAILFSYSRGWVALLLSVVVFLWQFRSRVVVALSHALFAVFLLVAISNEFLALYNVADVSVVVRESSPPRPEHQRPYVDYLQPNVPLTQLHAEVTYAPFSRALLRKAALVMCKERPWLGVGPGGFSYELYRRQREEGASWGGLQVSGPWDPHSTYLGGLAEVGMLGCVALVMVFSVGVWQLLSVLAARGSVPSSCLLWAVLSSLIGYVAFGWYDDLLTKRWVWFALGLGGAGFAITQRAGRGRSS